MTDTLAEATVAIIGLGLMGGSLGYAIDGACARRLGTDADDVAMTAALDAKVVDECGTLEAIASRADLIVLAAPVGTIVELIPRVAAAARTGTVITDLGSTKGAIISAFDALDVDVSAIGGHPMCGREKSGVGAATIDLFNGATWVVTPARSTTPHARALLHELIRAAGAHPIELDAVEHDRAVASASHLPYVTAQSLVAVLDRAPDAARELAATGFASATRVAGGSVDMWSSILTTNAPAVRDAIGAMINELQAIQELLDDPAALHQRLSDGRAAKLSQR